PHLPTNQVLGGSGNGAAKLSGGRLNLNLNRLI
ncbi:hypothetical protein L8106_25625, partial [Lyngbya sp. PCC 8106]